MAVNNTDLWTREGAYGLPGDPDALAGWRGPLDFPRIQGADAAGTVVALGDGAPAELLGVRVVVDPALYDGDGPDAHPVGLMGSERDGGAHPVVDRGAPIHEQVRELAPAGVDVVLDGVAGAIGGHRIAFDVRRLYLHDLQILGSSMHTPAHFDLLMEIARRGEIRPVIAEALPLAESAAAQERLGRRSHVGKIVLRP